LDIKAPFLLPHSRILAEERRQLDKVKDVARFDDHDENNRIGADDDETEGLVVVVQKRRKSEARGNV
jgi:hypothetical protein